MAENITAIEPIPELAHARRKQPLRRFNRLSVFGADFGGEAVDIAHRTPRNLRDARIDIVRYRQIVKGNRVVRRARSFERFAFERVMRACRRAHHNLTALEILVAVFVRHARAAKRHRDTAMRVLPHGNEHFGTTRSKRRRGKATVLPVPYDHRDGP